MRVLQAMAGRHPGGAEAFFARLVAALSGAGLEQRILVRHGAACAGALQAAGLAPVALPFGGLWDLVTRRRFRAEIAAFRPRVVLSWMGRATRFCPRDGFVHAARLGGYYDLKHYRHCRHLVANTRDIAAYVVRAGWPAARTHYLPNFVDARPAAPLARQALGCPETAPLLLALGRLHANKAFDVLLRALVALPGAHLCIAGEGPERTTLTALARTLGVADRTGFLGWRDDAPALLATADVLVCPSRREPLGNVVIEAWAHGCPVVAAAAAGPAGLIRDDASGLLVPVEDVAALAAAITRALADAGLRRRLIAGGRAAHAADFTEEAVVRRYLEFFGRIAA